MLKKRREQYAQHKKRPVADATTFSDSSLRTTENRNKVININDTANKNATDIWHTDFSHSRSTLLSYNHSEFIVASTRSTHSYVPNDIASSSTTRKRSTQSKGSKNVNAHSLENIADSPSKLLTMEPCKYCMAKIFYHEPNGFCCAGVEIALISNTIPNDLYDLYTSPSSNSKDFRTYIRTYNNTFAFTSLGVKYDKNLCKRNKGIYTFKIQGQVYHYINELAPTDNDPEYLQLYFYDKKRELSKQLTVSWLLLVFFFLSFK